MRDRSGSLRLSVRAVRMAAPGVVTGGALPGEPVQRANTKIVTSSWGEDKGKVGEEQRQLRRAHARAARGQPRRARAPGLSSVCDHHVRHARCA